MSAVLKQVVTSPGTEQQIVEIVLEQANNDPAAAAILLRDRIDRDPVLREKLLNPFVDHAIWQAIRKHWHGERSKAFTAVRLAGGRQDSADGIRAVAEDVLYNFPLPGGKRLGDASREDVEGAAAWYQTLADTNGKRAAWLRAIHAAMKAKSKSVREQLSEDTLRDLADRYVVEGA